MLSLEDLNAYLLYEPSDKTFPFIWKRRIVDNSGFNEQHAGTRAGCLTAQGYVQLDPSKAWSKDLEVKMPSIVPIAPSRPVHPQIASTVTVGQ